MDFIIGGAFDGPTRHFVQGACKIEEPDNGPVEIQIHQVKHKWPRAVILYPSFTTSARSNGMPRLDGGLGLRRILGLEEELPQDWSEYQLNHSDSREDEY